MLKYYCASIELLNEQSVFDQCLEKVNSIRKEKVLRCRREEDKKRSLMAGLLLRYALKKEGLDYDKLSFSSTSDGKPILGCEPGIHFSLSHSKDCACCLISDVPVGVDLEQEERVIRIDMQLENIAQKSLTEEELQLFEAQSEKEKKKYFLECWTKKEAYSKALGKGMQMDFAKIDTAKQLDAFWSVWTSDGYCVSIYKEDKDYQDLEIEKIKSVSCF